jgi:signal transduction histidine kinase/ActR/RegA family two-component response regulator
MSGIIVPRASPVCSMRKSVLKLGVGSNRIEVGPTETPSPSPPSSPRTILIDLPAEYVDGFVEIQDGVVLSVDPSIAALLANPSRLQDVVGKSITHFALYGWGGDRSAMSAFSDMAAGSRDRCRTPSGVSGKQLEWTAFKSKERANRCVLLATVREHQERATLRLEMASSHETSPSANGSAIAAGCYLDQRVLDKTEENERAQEQFRHKMEMLEQKNEAQRHFVSYLFHEIRVPFQAVILGISELKATLNDLIEKSPRLSDAGDYIKETPKAAVHITDDAFNLRPNNVRMHHFFQNHVDVINTVEEAAGSIEKLLDDVLSLHKLESGKFRIEPKPFLMSHLVQVAEKRSALAMAKANLLFKVRISPQALALEQNGTNLVLGDYHRILQVLTNLLSNASKFTPKGGAVVVDLVLINTVETKPWKLENDDDETFESDKTAVLQVIVTDTGVGIPPAKRDSIFLPYSQIQAGELQAGGGTGLGLCISNEFVQRHGGSVVVSENMRSPSSLLCDDGKDDGGTGSVFTVSLPLRVVRSQTKTPNSRKDKLGQISLHSTVDIASYKAHILLVEDSLPNQKMMGKLLQRYKLTFEIAHNGQEAVNRVVTEKERYLMILMDKEMPVMDGHAATKAIRKASDSVPIVGLTGNALDEQRIEFLACGADAVLTKPLSHSQFEHTIRRFMMPMEIL